MNHILLQGICNVDIVIWLHICCACEATGVYSGASIFICWICEQKIITSVWCDTWVIEISVGDDFQGLHGLRRL